jgi:hypothetical protein
MVAPMRLGMAQGSNQGAPDALKRTRTPAARPIRVRAAVRRLRGGQLVIDPLHSPLSQTDAFAMQTAVGDASPTPVLMRVGGPSHRSGIQQATDTGAAGMLVPNLRSVDDVRMARSPARARDRGHGRDSAAVIPARSSRPGAARG